MVKRFLPAGGASAVLALMIVARSLTPIPRAIAIGCIVVAWLSAALIGRVDVRAHITVVAAIAGVVAAGQVAGGLLYGGATVLFMLGCLVSMREARRDPMGSGAPFERGPAPASMTLPWSILAVIATALTAALVLGLPPLGARVERYVTSKMGLAGEEATAFSTTMVLGATRGMLQSDAIVMRIEGERPEYLRGAVYDRYDGRYWTMTGARDRTTIAADAPAGRSTTRITLARSAPRGVDMRWFLPPGACDLGLSSGRVDIDRFGVARRAKDDDPPTITLRTSGCSARGPSVSEPSPADVDLRNDVRAQIVPIAVAWASPYSTRRERLEAFRRELGKYEYSLSVPRDPGKDPIVDFLTVHRAGHCEMFASAMVLLARSIGIPARVVGGYRVDEVNPLTGKAIVRDRNAHAWVEAWVDGAWHGFDPTPISEGIRPPPRALDHLGDLFSAALDRVGAAVAKLTTFDIVVFLSIVIAVLLVVRSVLARLRRGRSRATVGDVTPPLPCFDRLSTALAAAGHSRDEAEPIEAFARRVSALGAPWAADVASALRAYAGLRYGGIGDEPAIVRAIEQAARAVRS